MTLLFGLMGIIWLCREACHGLSNKASTILLCFGLVGFCGLFAPQKYKNGYGFWAFESVGLSGLALYMPSIVFFGIDDFDKKKDRQKENEATKSCGYKCYMVLGTIIPIVYFWSLPFISAFPTMFS